MIILSMGYQMMLCLLLVASDEIRDALEGLIFEQHVVACQSQMNKVENGKKGAAALLH